MKKVAFPHMGHMAISVKAFLEELGAEPVTPPPISKKTMEIGVQHSPEFACLPLKVNMGNHLETLELGAEYILMAGGIGPCRFGYYAQVQQEILIDLQKEVKMITLEPNIFSIYHAFNLLHGRLLSPFKLYRILKYVLYKMEVIDRLEKVVHYVRPRAKNPRQVNARFREYLKKIDAAKSMERVKQLFHEAEGALRELAELDEARVIHIGLVGEIYQLLEPFVNLQIEERLGEMGVQVHRELFLGHWVLDHVLHRIDRTPYIEAARPYLDVMIGGHGQETVGRTVLYAREGVNGVIQVAPFTCMPEIVAESILPLVSTRENIPILSLFFDEHSGEAGLQTRLEAFVDLLRRKKGRGKNSYAGISGH